MNSTDIKAYGEAHKKIWANAVTKMNDGKFPLPTVGEVMLETWMAAKKHYEKEYGIPKAEGRL